MIECTRLLYSVHCTTAYYVVLCSTSTAVLIVMQVLVHIVMYGLYIWFYG